MVLINPFFVLTRSPCCRILRQVSQRTAIPNIKFSRGIHLTQICESDRRYSSKHEWVKLDNQTGTVGISFFAQDALGEVVYIQLPEVNTEIRNGEECGALESVKAASEIIAPVSGKVTEINSEVVKSPGIINSSCYDKGWLFKVKLSNLVEHDQLMDEKQYEEYLKSHAH